MKLKKIAALITLAASFAAPAFAAEWVVGANIGNVPWEFQDAKGNFVGFEIDLVNEVAKRTGNTVKIENIPLNGLGSALQSGRIQIAISSIMITPKRLESHSFSQPYFDNDLSLAVLKAAKINKLEDLSGKAVGVDTASTGDEWTTENMSKYKITKVSRYEGLAPAMVELAGGRIDGYISSVSAVDHHLKDKPQYRVAARILTGERFSFMFAKTFGDARKINDALILLKRDGFIAKTHQKWFGTMPPPLSSSVQVVSVPRL